MATIQKQAMEISVSIGFHDVKKAARELNPPRRWAVSNIKPIRCASAGQILPLSQIVNLTWLTASSQKYKERTLKSLPWSWVDFSYRGPQEVAEIIAWYLAKHRSAGLLNTGSGILPTRGVISSEVAKNEGPRNLGNRRCFGWASPRGCFPKFDVQT